MRSPDALLPGSKDTQAGRSGHSRVQLALHLPADASAFQLPRERGLSSHLEGLSGHCKGVSTASKPHPSTARGLCRNVLWVLTNCTCRSAQHLFCLLDCYPSPLSFLPSFPSFLPSLLSNLCIPCPGIHRHYAFITLLIQLSTSQ